jgi:hypothetical protein
LPETKFFSHYIVEGVAIKPEILLSECEPYAEPNKKRADKWGCENKSLLGQLLRRHFDLGLLSV